MAAPTRSQKGTLASFIFLSRWLQAPLYFGLIVAQAIYVYRFFLSLWELSERGCVVLDQPQRLDRESR
jgi:uncharacterized protein (TIGR00645 family)